MPEGTLQKTRVHRICAETGLDPRTVRRFMAGERLRSQATREAIIGACNKLGILVGDLLAEPDPFPSKESKS